MRRRAGEKVEAVGSIDHLCTLFPGIQRRQPGNQGANRGMTVDDIIVFPVDDFLEQLVSFQILRLPGHPFKGNIIVLITIWNHAVSRILIVIPGCHRRLPARLLKELQIGNMKLHDVGLYHGRHEQNLFLHTVPPHIGKNGHNFIHIIHLFLWDCKHK